MKHMIAFVVAAAVVLGGCASDYGQNDEEQLERLIARAVSRDPRLAECGDLAKVDFRNLPPEVAARLVPDDAAWAWTAERDLATRSVFGPFTPPADARVVMRMFAGATGHQELRTNTSSTVWQGADGVWRVDAVHHRTGGHPEPPPQPGEPQPTQEDRERRERSHVTGELDAAQAARVEAALARPCLAIQPDSVPMNIPLINGMGDFCWGGNGGTLFLQIGDRRRIISDSCARYDAGVLMYVVMYPHLKADDPA